MLKTLILILINCFIVISNSMDNLNNLINISNARFYDYQFHGNAKIHLLPKLLYVESFIYVSARDLKASDDMKEYNYIEDFNPIYVASICLICSLCCLMGLCFTKMKKPDIKLE